MSVLFNDTFQSYAAGNGVPNNFNGFGIVFTSQFIDTGTQRPPTPAPGFYEKTGIIYALFGSIAYPVNSLLATTATQLSTVAWTTLGPFGGTNSFGTISLCNTDPTPPHNQVNLLTVVVESDYSVSLAIPGLAKINSLQQVFYPSTWHECSLTIQVGDALVSGIHFLTVIASLYVNGQAIILTAGGTTSVPKSSTWNNSPTINQWLFNGIANGDYFSEIAATNDTQTLPWYPNLAMMIHALHSQQVVELIEGNFSPNARMSQQVVELIEESSICNARMSQQVVELILKGTFSGGLGFYVREC